ncbi:PilZ domain-containing protein [Nocardioides daeguensis]|uniref:PilZ domain-containing protein n=1 Tax=Nocardioides daeguensis TaxID=908359 RepID=A0ABP6W1P5_9ACTN|nr:PilZ domain-containing protein [Nocardioides daeguensis]MBV6726779.1 PilZ domain-containing protein [Nocardioides daeguensis]MCR1774469.1 PilZ domain-containing protein [Nocardioides daeguensis]
MQHTDVQPDLHPTVLQTVALTLRPTAGEPVALETKVLDLEPQADGSTTLVVACPVGLDPSEHHFDVTLAWTYPLGRMECPVSTRPGRRSYGDVWLLRPSSPPARLQQRAYFRARISMPVLLRWTPDPAGAGARGDGPDEAGDPLDPHDPLEPIELLGVVVDVSEGGLMACVRTQPPPVGTTVEATTRVDGDNLVQGARVVRHVRFASGGLGVGIAFVDPSVHGDRIRRLVFETERRRRRRR